MTDREAAFAEMQHLQEIIARHEQHVFWLRTTLLAAMGGLYAGYFADKIDVSRYVVTGAALFLALVFFTLELFHRRLVRVIILRGVDVERQIRANPAGASGWYDGPLVGETCAKARNHSIFWEFKVEYTWPYAALLVVAIFGFCLLPSSQNITHMESAGAISSVSTRTLEGK